MSIRSLYTFAEEANNPMSFSYVQCTLNSVTGGGYVKYKTSCSACKKKEKIFSGPSVIQCILSVAQHAKAFHRPEFIQSFQDRSFLSGCSKAKLDFLFSVFKLCRFQMFRSEWMPGRCISNVKICRERTNTTVSCRTCLFSSSWVPLLTRFPS